MQQNDKKKIDVIIKRKSVSADGYDYLNIIQEIFKNQFQLLRVQLYDQVWYKSINWISSILANGPNPAYCLFLSDLWAKKGFAFLNG